MITDRAELVAEVRLILRSIQKLPQRIIGYFHARYTKYALDTFLVTHQIVKGLQRPDRGALTCG